jgi:hypothetical protein
MKNLKFKFLSAFVLSLIGCFLFAPVVADAFTITPQEAFVDLLMVDVALNVGVFTYVVIAQPQAPLMPKGAYDIQKEIWADTLVRLLFKDNSFITKSFNEDKYVMQGKVVHIPRATGSVEVVKNRTSLPAAAVERTREDVTYALDEYTSTPTVIPNADKVELSFDAIAEALYEHDQSLQEQLGDEFCYLWRPTAGSRILRTLGSAVGPVGSQTGNRKIFTKESLQRAKFLMNKANIAKEGRFALLPSEFMDQLQNDPELKSRDNSMELDMKNGVVTRLYGFDIMERSDVLTYNTATTPVAKLPDAVGASTDNLGALIWQKDCVTRAKGDVMMFDSTNNPLYYGDLYSALVRAGGRVRRDAGVLSIVQDASA